MNSLHGIVIRTWLVGAVLLPAAGADETPPDFSREVRPILSDKCFKCHGPDSNARQADLRLDRAEDARRVLSPAKPSASELVRRISTADPDDHMPPPASKLVLTDREIDILTRWVRDGGKYQGHWSFQPVRDVAPPEVKQAGRFGQPIDRFVLARLQREKLTPAAEATREQLIRRLSFDLTGLPPTIAEIDAYLADRAENAYEKLVDRLLKKVAYGERMAAEWLDLARYSDTYGYQVDRERYVWPWRDWVVRAFNENMPYDQFLTWQLAGDLLPGATDDMRLATTFNRLHSQKVEGGSTLEEFRVEYVADRNHTFAMAFMGLTLECARCHEHKFDPIAHREYYQFFAFFNNIDESGVYSYFTPSVPTPTLLLTDEKQKAAMATAEKQIAAAEGRSQQVGREQQAAFTAWLAARPEKPELPGRVAHLDFENLKGGANRVVDGRFGKAVQLSGDDGIGTKVGNFRRFQPFSVSLWINTPEVKKRAVLFHRSRAWTDAGSRGYQLLLEDGRLSASLIHFWPGNAIRVRTRSRVPVGSWHHVVMTWDGSNRAAGLKIYVDGRPAACEVVRDNLYKNITGGGGDNITIGERFRDRGFAGGKVDEFSVYNRRLTDLEIAQLFDGHSLADALGTPSPRLTPIQKAALREYFLETVSKPFAAQRTAVGQAREQRSKAVDGLREIMVMADLDPGRQRQTFILKRGAYDAPGEPVRPGTPAALPPFPAGQPRNRLGLAHWLTRSGHPLTPRVAINRLWQQCFGYGLVRTPEDFGSQGQPPTHPDLLDWLAHDLVSHGWDIKRSLKQIVLSATYRQSSRAGKELLSRDPSNQLLARGPAHQLTAEMIRDAALSTSGLLVDKQGGRPARPYDLALSFKPLKADQGEGLYRRSLYTYWKRTGPAPVMMTLDASKRDVCVVKRERTDSALQACVLLNGPQFVEAARVLGQVLLKKHGEDTAALVNEMFRRLTSRRPSEKERDILVRAFQEQLEYFQADPRRAEAFLKTGHAGRDKELPAVRVAAAGMLANTLMNFDECVMKR